MIPFALASAILLFTVQTLCFKEFNRSYMRNTASYFIFNTAYFSIVAAIFGFGGPLRMRFEPATLMLGPVFGALFIVTMLLYMKAMGIGPLSYTALALSFGVAVPVALGILLWGERIGPVRASGLLLLFLAYYLGSRNPNPGSPKISLRWILLCVFALIGNGMLMAVTKYHQILLPDRQIREFLTLAFGSAALLSLALYLWRAAAARETVAHMNQAGSYLLMLGAGVSTAFGNQLSLYLAGRVPAVTLFPTVNGSIVILSSIVSVFLYREKLSRSGIAGLACGLAGLVLLGAG